MTLQAFGVFTRHRSKTAGLVCLFAMLCSVHTSAQPVARAPVPTPSQAVGASEIFDALTQTDAPSDLQRLRALRDSLAGNPDAKTLNDIRVQLDTLLRDAEHRQGEMPPPLVMSGIASRIDTAMTRLDAARPAAAIVPSFEGPPWLLPALGALAGTLAVGLAACLAALVAQGRSAEESDELREALSKIRRKLDDVASGARKAQDSAGDLTDDAAGSLQEAAMSITRLGSSAKEAESLLRTSSEAAEQRLQNAVAVASQLETWLEELPSRLSDAIGEPEDSDLRKIGTAAPPLFDRSFIMPDFLSSVQEACDEMRLTTEALAHANLAAQQAPVPENGENAALATEMVHLSFGHALKLDDVISELAQASAGLPDLTKTLAEAMAELPLQVERNEAAARQFEAANARAEHAWAQLGLFIEQVLPEKLTEVAEAITASGVGALGTAAYQCAEVVKMAADAATSLPASLREAVSAIGEAGATQQAALAEVASRLTQCAESLPETGTSIANSAETLKRLVARDARREAVTRASIGEISAAAQSARADLAATAEAVSAMPAQNDRLATLLRHGEDILTVLQAKAAHEAGELHRSRNEALAGVEVAIGRLQVAAERLYAGADAQEQALARVRRAAMTVATLAGADATLGTPTIDETGKAHTA